MFPAPPVLINGDEIDISGTPVTVARRSIFDMVLYFGCLEPFQLLENQEIFPVYGYAARMRKHSETWLISSRNFHSCLCRTKVVDLELNQVI